jgi:hypothetical protein
MKEKSKEKKDKGIKETIDFVAERLARILWEHWLWMKRKDGEKQVDEGKR